MTLSLARGKHVVCRVTGPNSADVVADGAVLQRDGQIEAVGDYRELRRQHPDAEVIGSGNHIVMPGLVNDHFHVGLTPFQMGAPDLPLEMWSLARIGTRLIDPHLDQLYGAVQMIETGTTTVQAIHSPGRGLRARKPGDRWPGGERLPSLRHAGLLRPLGGGPELDGGRLRRR